MINGTETLTYDLLD